MREKLDKLKSELMEYDRVAVAFSGGCDSTFLLKVCKEVLNTEVVALIARGPIHKAKEIEAAIEFCVEEGIAYSVLDLNSLDVPGFKENSPNRCYICKALLAKIQYPSI